RNIPDRANGGLFDQFLVGRGLCAYFPCLSRVFIKDWLLICRRIRLIVFSWLQSMQLGMSLWEDQAMKRKQVGVSVIAFVLLAGPALAETARGVITKVDLNNKELTIRGKARGSGKGSLTFRLSDDARVMVAGQKGTAKDLHPGRRVRVQ